MFVCLSFDGIEEMDEFWNVYILPALFLFFKLSAKKKSCGRKSPFRLRVPARLRVDFLRARENNARTVPAERARERASSPNETKTHKLEGSRNMIETTATVRVRFSETDVRPNSALSAVMGGP